MKLKMTLLIVFFVTVSVAAIAETAFVKKVPNGAKFDCLTCHTSSKGGKGWNAFGTTIRTSFLSGTTINWGPALAKLDSDGDGRTNGEELGDPEGTWKLGNANPGVLANITNPGDKASVTSVNELLLSNEYIKINGFYPNPGNLNSVLSFNLIESGMTNISIFNSNGTFLDEIEDAYLAAGEHNYKILNKIKHISNGTYFIRISSGRFFTLQKIIINN